MDFLKKILLIIFILGAIYCIRTVLMPSDNTEVKTPPENTTKKENISSEIIPDKTSQKEFVYIYFIGQNSNREDVYKIIKRNFDKEKDGTKLDFAINELLKGPNAAEKAQGIYSEIPKDTKLRSISKINGKKYVDLSSDFEQGGGTDGLYKRLYQLIKTVNKNTTEDVYLKIEGREVDVIGGEGIMFSQPLSPHSLDN